MNTSVRTVTVLSIGVAGILASLASAQDWPQWRGSNRDAKASGFVAPATWPQQLTEKWKVAVGDGVATPAVVGDKIYVFARQEGNEVIRCLDAGTGKEIWRTPNPGKDVMSHASLMKHRRRSGGWISW